MYYSKGSLALFFPDQQQIDRVQLESAFNTFVERRECYVAQVADNGLSSLVYFIVLREMMHPLECGGDSIRTA